MKTVGIVLAGGLSRRFGSPKAFARMGNKYFYEYATAALAPHCDQIVIVTRPEHVEHFSNELHVITDDDRFTGLGPLAGIYSVMNIIAAKRYVILPCDMPYIEASVIEGLMPYRQEDVIAVKTSDTHHPLVSVWHWRVKEKLQQSLEQRRLSVMKFLKEVDILWVDGDGLTKHANKIFKNINYETDLERGEENE
ncbi:molybdenum cofactor guanylyltransferase [Sporosarcina ureilytica]|uniref:Probable molybdenum cofactor guanylyltransferase n=1 Tax=Sporosarcina ureilytica TaxID=298596 RepID=A0A1D8JJS4_9BACL|nr:molybdenum cofactor guanylyltransferase [Sporosarcina ureilytica]AOV08954.1 hypothetical protein BI350_16290 [Sporosarcina ureilytica]